MSFSFFCIFKHAVKCHAHGHCADSISDRNPFFDPPSHAKSLRVLCGEVNGGNFLSVWLERCPLSVQCRGRITLMPGKPNALGGCPRPVDACPALPTSSVTQGAACARTTWRPCCAPPESGPCTHRQAGPRSRPRVPGPSRWALPARTSRGWSAALTGCASSSSLRPSLRRLSKGKTRFGKSCGCCLALESALSARANEAFDKAHGAHSCL